MSAAPTESRRDPLRKAAIIAVLVAIMILLYRFSGSREAAIDPTGMVALGFVILAGYTLGELVQVIKLPHITGYLLGGMLMGPSMAHTLPDSLRVGPFEHGILNDDVLQQLGIFNALALALIALTAGGELKIDALRRDLRSIVGMLGGQILTVVTLCGLFVYSISGIFPAISLAGFTGVGGAQVLAYAALLASVALANSPAATIAVINGAGAKGPFTRTVLSTVVLTDVAVVVMFSLAGAYAGQTLGATAIEGGLLTYLAVHLVGSIALGAAMGGGLALYLRFVRNEVTLFLVATIYATTYVTHQLHMDPLLTFMAAGFVTSNFSPAGLPLIHNVERLSMPVYVVLFTLAGANLHLDAVAVMAPYAIGLVVVRAFALWLGVRIGAQVAGADKKIQQHAWMGFVSQAGVALSLTTMISDTYGDVGAALSTMLISALAINELFGPVLFKVGLGLAGEIAGGQADELDEETEAKELDPAEVLKPWAAPEHLPDPWGEPLASQSAQLNSLVNDLETGLSGIVRDLLQGPMAELGNQATAYLRGLRREFLRHHRKATMQAQGPIDPDALAKALRLGEAALAERWRATVLDRAARMSHEGWSPLALVEQLDDLVDNLPESLRVPVEPKSYEVHDEESPWLAIQRSWLRARKQWRSMSGQPPPHRRVRFRTLARYQLSGRVPPDLEALASLMVNADTHLANRTRSVFEAMTVAYDAPLELAARGASAEAVDDALAAARKSVEQEFTLALHEINHIVSEGALRVAGALGHGLRRLKRDCLAAGTHELPDYRRRYSRVFSERTRGITKLTEDLRAARAGNAAQYSVLALELELIGLKGRVKEALDQQADQLARMIGGRGPTQLERVQSTLQSTLDQLERALDGGGPAEALATSVRTIAEPLERVVSEAIQAERQLRTFLTDEEGTRPLLNRLLTEASRLTDRYTVPTTRMALGERSLPARPSTAEVPTRELTIAYIEASVSRNLARLSKDLSATTEQLAKTLEELERVVAFNVELAGAELDVLGTESAPSDTLDIVREMLLGALGRSHQRVGELLVQARTWPERARSGIREAVLGDLEEFRTQLVDGRVTDLRFYLLRRRASGARLAQDAEELTGGLWRMRDQAEEFVSTAVGGERIDRLRRVLGLPVPEGADDVSPATFRPPGRSELLPVVYRRLFSDQALEAGDLLTGRQDEISHARAALSGKGGKHLAVAVVGLDGAGKGAVLNAVLRSTTANRLIRPRPTAPVTVDQVDAWLRDLAPGDLVVLDSLQWLFTARPGGFAPLRRFVDGVVANPGVSWLVGAATGVWQYAAQAAPLEDAFPKVVRLRPLSPGELQAAILARHEMSGYGLRFDAQGDIAWQVRRLLTRQEDQLARERDAWFATLHQATDGIIHDALTYWMASIRMLDTADNVVRIGPVIRPPLASLRRLSEDVWLTLGQVLRQGWVTADLHAELFRQDRSESAAHLAHLAHYGLLVDEDGRYVIATHLLTPVHRVLQERGWVA